MSIPIIDLHCDALLRMQDHRLRFLDSPKLDVNLERLRTGHVMAQAFAIYIYPNFSLEEKRASALKQIAYFQNEVLGGQVVQIKQWADFEKLQPEQIGAFLTIEGVDFFGGDLSFWHEFYALGVLSIGLTWNNPNEAADGLHSTLKRGVTSFGKDIIALNNQHKIFTDVAHLSEQSFWDVIEHADYVISSHSNAAAVCPHERNLTDAQIRAMIAKNAPIHVVYFPEFINGTKRAMMSDLIRHIEHICALGGKHLVGFGSDFDGINAKISSLEHAGMHQNLVNELLKYYSEADVRGFAYANFLKHLPR
ncbi:dipeptidase [Solibacillus silvestris]|uniref:dipeptidase n=1 Tax=Solibacillus silvestris TaxID=76853 RepID=UPI003F806503